MLQSNDLSIVGSCVQETPWSLRQKGNKLEVKASQGPLRKMCLLTAILVYLELIAVLDAVNKLEVLQESPHSHLQTLMTLSRLGPHGCHLPGRGHTH